MARDLCREIISTMTGKDTSSADVERLEKIVTKRADALRAAEPSLTENEAITRAAELVTAQTQSAVAAKRRAALLNESKRLQAVGQITQNWGSQYGLGVRSMVTGTQRNVKGARVSAANQQDAVRAQLLGGLQAGLAKLGKEDLRLFLSDTVEMDVGRALWQLSQEVPDEVAMKRLSPAATRIAKVIHQYQELSRGLANKEGAAIGKYAGYVVRASHDITRISGEPNAWKAAANKYFDLPRMMAEMDYATSDQMIDALYQGLASGLHLKDTPAPVTGKSGMGNLANRLSKERVIHYRDADAFMAYNGQFGAGNLREAVISGLERSARSIGLMQVMGTNPTAFIDSLENQLARELKKKSPDNKTVTRFRDDIQAARNRLKEVDGSLDIPGNSTLAQYSSAARMLQTMASLGGSLLSSVNDLGVFMASARHNGLNIFQAGDAAVRGLFKGRSHHEVMELASALGVVFESMSGKMASRFSLDDGVRGGIASGQQLFFKLNGQNWWTDSLRFAAAEMLSHNLAGHANKAWGALDPRLTKTLGLYGLDERGWDVARKAVKQASDGKSFITPDAIEDEAVSRALRAYFTDQNGYIMLSPDSESRYLTKAGTQKGTVAGELVRFMAQFKSFTVAFSQRLIGREIIGNIDPNVRGLGVWKEAALSGQAWVGMSQLILMSTLFGYLAMAMKDALKGKEPRDPTDPKTMFAAMQQGGGMGIMGDFLFGQQNRAGGGFIGTLAGPMAGDIESLAGIYFKARDAALDPEKEAELGDDLYRITYSNLPGNNLFYVKPVLDYLILWNLQETLNPGAMRRLERNAEKQGQEYFISPSQRVSEQ